MQAAPPSDPLNDLCQSLKLNKPSEPVLENQNVFANVGGDWHMGVVVSVRNDALQRMTYSIRVNQGVYDLPRERICPHVHSVPKQQALRGLPRWQPGIFRKLRKSSQAASTRESPANGSSQTPALPSAAAGLPLNTQQTEDGEGRPLAQAVVEGVTGGVGSDSVSSDDSAWSARHSDDSSGLPAPYDLEMHASVHRSGSKDILAVGLAATCRKLLASVCLSEEPAAS